jgi:flagellar L-ring protein FlgH
MMDRSAIDRPATARTAPFAVLLAGLLFCGGASAQSLWRDDGRLTNLVANNAARRLGDTLTVVIVESSDIQNSDTLKTDRSGSLRAAITSFDIAPDAFNTLPKLEASHQQKFDGTADQAKKASFVTRIQVSVLDVLPNGNLVVVGRRTIRVDDEVKTIEIRGVVRALDVTAQNTVKSEQVAEASVSYVGDGPLTRATTKGAVASIFDFLFHLLWPF